MKRVVPRRLRLLRYGLQNRLKYYPLLVWNLGKEHLCPFCGWSFRKFLSGGVESPLFSRLQVIPGGKRPNVSCPHCDSNDRERLQFLYLKNKTDLFTRSLKVLHCAPEPCLRKAIRSQSPARYVTADLQERNVSLQLDVTAVPFRDGAFDLIICNHVLEHIPDDGKAMAELYRVLKPGGRAILQVPLAPALADTIEDPTVRTAEDRLKIFGQRDHVRLYGRDYPGKLRAAGFEVNVFDYQAELGETLSHRYALLKDEKIFEAFRPVKKTRTLAS